MKMLVNLATIYSEHANALYAFLLNLMRSESDARDVLHDVFTRLLQTPQLLDGVINHRSWLMKLCHRKALDSFRKKSTRERMQLLAHDELCLFVETDAPESDSFQKTLAIALG